jgi:hypothetical protein
MSKLRAVGCSCFAMAVVLPIVLIVVGEVVLPQVIVARLNELRHGYTELGRSESHSPWGLPHWPSLARPLSALLAVVRRAPARWVPKRGRGRGGTPVWNGAQVAHSTAFEPPGRHRQGHAEQDRRVDFGTG